MNKKQRAKTYNLGEYSFVVLDSLDRKGLFEHISAINNNLQASVKRESVLRARLRNCCEYFEKQGLSEKDINDIIQLNCEKY